jgi:hypothetical protein
MPAAADFRPAPPLTVAGIEIDLLRQHSSAVHYERRIREYLAIRRAVQKRNGMARLDGWGKSERYVFLIKSTIECLRAARKEIAALNAEVDGIERARIAA